MTPSQKLKRNVVLRDFAHEVDALYSDTTQNGDAR